MAPQKRFELFSHGRTRVNIAFSVDWAEAERTYRYMMLRVSGNAPHPGVCAIPVTVEIEYWFGSQMYPFPRFLLAPSLEYEGPIRDTLEYHSDRSMVKAEKHRAALQDTIEKALKYISPHVFRDARESHSVTRIQTLLLSGLPEILEVAINSSETSLTWLQEESRWARVLLRTSEK